LTKRWYPNKMYCSTTNDDALEKKWNILLPRFDRSPLYFYIENFSSVFKITVFWKITSVNIKIAPEIKYEYERECRWWLIRIMHKGRYYCATCSSTYLTTIMSWKDDIAYAMTPSKFLTWPLGVWPLQKYNIFALIRTVVCVVSLVRSS